MEFCCIAQIPDLTNYIQLQSLYAFASGDYLRSKLEPFWAVRVLEGVGTTNNPTEKTKKNNPNGSNGPWPTALLMLQTNAVNTYCAVP